MENREIKVTLGLMGEFAASLSCMRHCPKTLGHWARVMGRKGRSSLVYTPSSDINSVAKLGMLLDLPQKHTVKCEP